jgi:ATP-dependent helicase/nuclease subunit A
MSARVLDDECESIEMNSSLYEKLREDFAFEYPFSDLRRIPAKISVSRLSPDVLDQSDVSVDLFDSEIKPTVPAFFLSDQRSATAAERGTATHLFLQFCDFAQLANKGVDECLATLVDKKFIPQAIADIVYKDELEAFRHSSLIREILDASKVIREQRFNILLPASELSQDEEFKQLSCGQTVAVQGVIDLILVDSRGNIRLYDYKTDRLTKAELENGSFAKNKLNSLHALQLSYYARAVSVLFSKAPERVAIYSTHAHESFDISICALDVSIDTKQ